MNRHHGRTPSILFLCGANSARSQMAEGLARAIDPRADVYSAGSHPSQVHLLATRVMAEIGLDISRQRSKSLAEIPLERVKTVISLCAEGQCPTVLADVDRFSWSLPDPAALTGAADACLEAFRRTRDDLASRLEVFLEVHVPCC